VCFFDFQCLEFCWHLTPVINSVLFLAFCVFGSCFRALVVVPVSDVLVLE